VVHRGQQVDLPALSVPGAAQRLAVDRDRPPPLLLLAGTVGSQAPTTAASAVGSTRARPGGW
jgi:hypothetical protein